MKRLVPFAFLLLAVAAAIYVISTPSRPPGDAPPSPGLATSTSVSESPPPPLPPSPSGPRSTVAPSPPTPRIGPTSEGSIVCPASIGAAVRGRVLDASGQPLENAGVWLAGWRGEIPTETAARWQGQTPIEHVARTDHGGVFLFENLPPVFRYEVRALARGFAPRRAGPVVPDPGETADVGDIVIRPGGRLSGKILDGEDRPIRGATVAALPLPGEGGLEEVLPFAGVESGVAAGADGSFSIPDAPPGRVALVVDAYGYARSVREVRVEPGAESPGLVVRLSSGGTISGTIEHDEEEEVEGAIVRAEAQGQGPSFLVEADDFGEFEIDGVPDGVPYRLTIEAPGYARASVEARAGDDEVEVRVASRLSVRGEIVEGGGDPVEYALVALIADAPEWRLPVREVGASAFRSFALEDGTFSIEVPSPGRYRVVAVAPGFAPGASEPFPVTDEGKQDLRVTLHSGAEVRGVVRGGGRFLAAEVSLLESPRPGERVPDGRGGVVPSEGTRIGRTTADRQGRFTFARVPAGSYLLAALADGFSPARTAAFEIRATQAKLEATIDLSRPGTIRGSVRADEATLAGVKVVSFGPDGLALEALPDAAGAFAIGGAPPGRHEVCLFLRTRPSAEFRWLDLATATEQALAHAPVDVPEGGQASVTLEPAARRGAVVRGTVRRNGGPGAGLAVSVLEGAAPLPIAREAPTDAEGRFTLEGVKPGPTTLVVRAAVRAGGPGLVLGKATLEVAEDRPNEVEIPIRVGRLRGRVLRADGSGAPGARITFAPDAEKGGARDLVPLSTRWVAVAEPDGSFDGGEAPEGAYLLTVESTDAPPLTASVALDPFADSIGELRFRPPTGR